MSKKIKIAVVGLGGRGKDSYLPILKQHPDKVELVAVADIVLDKVEEVAKEYNLPSAACFNSAEELLAKERLADAIFITTQDRDHVGQAMVALEKGYHILLEKPISPDAKECVKLARAAKQYQRQVIVCHVLRYTSFFTKLKEILADGQIGEITTVVGLENVGWWHQAHSFVRGNWANAEETSPMILAKCCHDMDLYLWLTGKTCESISSFGNTYLFKKEQAPAGAAKRCLDGCKVKETCLFDAEKIYMDNDETGVRKGRTGWPLNVVALQATEESVLDALKTGPYGRCVFHCDNNVVDHQIVNMHMTDGTLISFTMSGFTADISRYCKIMGTTGEVIGEMEKNLIHIREFNGKEETIDLNTFEKDLSGHGGGDGGLIQSFLAVLRGETKGQEHITSIEASVESHYCALAAEESRLAGGKVVYLSTYRDLDA